MNATATSTSKITYSENALSVELNANGQLVNSDLVKDSDVAKIQKATLKELKAINDNVNGNILDKIILDADGNFGSLAQ